MKILRISLANLASLAGSHTVDFTREPLRSAGLFAISGPMGSGKSTLLDALCVALYEDTPRLRAVGQKEKLMDGAKEITQKDPRNLLSRGAAEGFAEVAFVGVDGETYTARWSVRRARNKAAGALQESDVVLLRGNVPHPGEGAIVQGGKKREVQAVIAAKVGLTFAQFTRAVLLAQNEFATFLKAEDGERAEILEALTGTERFAQISKSVYARCSAEKVAVAEIEAQLAGHAPMTPEARATAESEVTAAETEVQSAKARVEARIAQEAWFARGAEWRAEREKAAKKHAAAIAARESAQPRRVELEHTALAGAEARILAEAERRAHTDLSLAEKRQAEAAEADARAQTARQEAEQRHAAAMKELSAATAAWESAKPQLQAARELDNLLGQRAERLSAATRQLELAEGSFKTAKANRDRLERDRKKAEKEQGEIAEKRAALVHLAPLLPQAQAWLDRVERAHSAQSALETARKNLIARIHEEKKTVEFRDAERAQETPLRHALEQASAVLKTTEAAARQFDGEKLAAARRAADEARAALRALGDWWREFVLVRAQAQAAQMELADLKAQDEAESRALAEISSKQLPEAEAAWEAARHALELAEAAVADAAVHLREKLQSGEACPVCGALEHPYTARAPGEDGAALRALKKNCTEREKAVQALRARLAESSAAVPLRRTQFAEKSKAAEQLAARLREAQAASHQHPAAVESLAKSEAERAIAITAKLSAEEEKLKKLDVEDQAWRAAEKEVLSARERWDKASAAVADLERKLSSVEKDLVQRQSLREAATAEVARCEATWKGSIADVEPIFASWPAARPAFERAGAQFRATLAMDLGSLGELEKRGAELGMQIREIDSAKDSTRTVLAEAETNAANRKTEAGAARTEHETTARQRAEIFSGRSANVVEAGLSEAARLTGEARDRWVAARNETAQRAATTTEAVRATVQGLAEAKTRQAEAIRQIETWLASFAERMHRPLDRAGLAILLDRDDAWVRRERADLHALELAVSDAAGAFAERAQMLEQHDQSRPTPDDEATVKIDLAAQRDALAATEARRDEARAKILSDDQRQQQSAALARQLAERRAAADPWERLNDLIGSSDGAKFRNIAQRRSLEILLSYANAQLVNLNGRYQLARLPESLNLIIIDRDMGDERRSVHSLSGGESFLVSLALALALASLTSNRLRIESLFIDEGFGSLDPETLGVAMGALMRLEAQGRKVGVISHVAEMADAIPVQIRVVKGRSGTSHLLAPNATEPLPSDDTLQGAATTGA